MNLTTCRSAKIADARRFNGKDDLQSSKIVH